MEGFDEYLYLSKDQGCDFESNYWGLTKLYATSSRAKPT